MEKLIESPDVVWSPVALVTRGAGDIVTDEIYTADKRSVHEGMPDNGHIQFFRASSADVGETNAKSGSGKLDYAFVAKGIVFQIDYPRYICDGALLEDHDGAPVADPLAGRILASRYTRFFQLFMHHTYLRFKIVDEVVCNVKLSKVGSGPRPSLEGLAVTRGEGQTRTIGEGEEAVTFVPSVAAFSARCGDEGRLDAWSLGREGVLLEDQQGFTVETITDVNITTLINGAILAEEFLYEDVAIGIRLKAGFVGEKYKRPVYGVRSAR